MNPGYAPAPTSPMAPKVSRNSIAWKKLAIAAVVVSLLLVVFVIGLVSLVFHMMKSSDPYKYGIALAQNDQRVVSALGAPVIPDWYLTGNINESAGSGTADLAIPLNGKLHHGILYVVAQRSAGEWTYKTLELSVENSSSRLKLLPEADGPADSKDQ